MESCVLSIFFFSEVLSSLSAIPTYLFVLAFSATFVQTLWKISKSLHNGTDLVFVTSPCRQGGYPRSLKKINEAPRKQFLPYIENYQLFILVK